MEELCLSMIIVSMKVMELTSYPEGNPNKQAKFNM